MPEPSNAVFISYRRSANPYLAQLVWRELTDAGIDAFYDIESIDAGQFDQIILNQIAARPYFMPILTPGTLQRCQESGDWLLREIQEALLLGRMIVPLHTTEFKFDDIDSYLPPKIATALKKYNGMEAPPRFFKYAMQEVRDRFLKPIVLPNIRETPPSDVAVVAYKQKLADAQPEVTDQHLTAVEYFERGLARYELRDFTGAIADWTEVIRLNPQFADAYNNRGLARAQQKDYAGAIANFTEAIRLNPENASVYNSRGLVRYHQMDYAGAMADCTEAIRLNPQNAGAYNNRGLARAAQKDYAGAIADYTRSIELKNPELHLPYSNRGSVRASEQDYIRAIADYNEAIRLNPQFPSAFLNRALAFDAIGNKSKAAADYQRVLELRPNDPYIHEMREYIAQHGGK